MLQVLLIDDDCPLAQMLTELLSYEDMTVTHAETGPQGLELALSQTPFDVILLDVMLPQLNGFSLLEQLRQQSQLPVIMLTAKGDPADRVRGLNSGADDYLPKPFTDAELIARIQSVTRRYQASQTQHQVGEPCHKLSSASLLLDQLRASVCVNQHPISLTGTELELLHELLSHPGEVLSKDYLSRVVLGRRQLPYDRSLDMHISQLRKKLSRQMPKVPIVTRRGQGYLWAEAVEQRP